jgi:hypothetical protein
VLKRPNAILIAATAHGLLAQTVWYLFPFLAGGFGAPVSSPGLSGGGATCCWF